VSVKRLPGLCRSGCHIKACGYRRSPGTGAPGWALPIGNGHRATGISRRAGAGRVPGGVRHRGLRVPAITRGRVAGVGPADWDRPPGYRDEPPGGCRSCAGRGVTSRPAGTGAHLGPGPVFSWPPGYRDEPPGGCRGCAGRGVTSRPAGTGDHLGPGPPGWALPIGIGHRATGISRRAGAGRGATSRPAGTGDHLGPGPVGWALPIGIGHWATGMSRRAGAGRVPVGCDIEACVYRRSPGWR